MALSSDNIANFHADSAMDDTATSVKSSAPSSPSSTGPRRRSSAALFSNLESLKQPATDEDKIRRASMSDQQRKSGTLFTFFQNMIGRTPS
jgi:hypothetical protein